MQALFEKNGSFINKKRRKLSYSAEKVKKILSYNKI